MNASIVKSLRKLANRPYALNESLKSRILENIWSVNMPLDPKIDSRRDCLNLVELPVNHTIETVGRKDGTTVPEHQLHTIFVYRGGYRFSLRR